MSLRGPVDRRPPERIGRSEGSPIRWVVVTVILGVAGFFAIRPGEGESPFSPAAEPSASVATATPPAPEALPRCTVHGPSGGYRIGASPPPSEADDDPPLLPFSVEVGRAVAYGGGFAVGVKRDRDGGSHHEVALVDERVENGRLVALGRSRGDLDAPVVAAAGEGWLAALLEPNAGGLSLRLGRPDPDGAMRWGAEIEQGRDESLAFDVAIGAESGAVVWDDLEDDRAVVMLATVSPELEARGKPAVVSAEQVDAELPRVIAREGGFWLAYVARARIEGAGERSKPSDPDDPPRYAAERIDPSWIELLPLDRQGRPAGVPRAVTPRSGHVLAFDLAPGEGGAAILAWRDDDTPSGAQGGAIATMLVGAAGEGQTQPVADEDVGAGVPTLLGGFLAIPDAEGNPRLAPIGGDGALLGELRSEPALRRAQILAASGEVILAARHAGKGIELIAVKCDRSLGRIE